MKKYSSVRTKKIHETVFLEHPVNITSEVTIGRSAHIGRYTYVSEGSRINSGTVIGRYCSIAADCEIGAQNHPTNWLSTHPFQYTPNQFKTMPDYLNIDRKIWRGGAVCRIGNDVWIGSKAIVCRGVQIGDGAIIGAGSFVNKDVPDYSIVVGSPAKIIKYRFSSENIEAFKVLKWWNLPIEKLSKIPFDDVNACINALKLLT